MPLREGLIFIDGDDEKQVQFALKVRTQKEKKLKIVLVKGMPLKLQKQNKVWIYFDQGGVITRQFGINQIPALVEQDGLKLKISITEVSKL
jgi:conjugal transfer pilus assembly protein TraW